MMSALAEVTQLGLHIGSKKPGKISIVFEDFFEKFSLFSNRKQSLIKRKQPVQNQTPSPHHHYQEDSVRSWQ